MKATITGSAVVITADLKLDDLKKLKKYRPESLTLTDESKEPTFAIGTTPGCGEISRYGIEFSETAPDAEGRATCTMILSVPNTEGISETVADLIGGSLLKLQELERKLPDIIAEMNQERALLLDSITIC